MKDHKNLKGFTLIEILIVIGLIAILAAITVIALNPGDNFAKARDARRQSDVTQIMDVFTRWLAAPEGNALSDVKGTGGGTLVPCPSLNALAPTWGLALPSIDSTLKDTLFPGGEATIPKDPSGGEYKICNSGGNALVILAPQKEDNRDLVYVVR